MMIRVGHKGSSINWRDPDYYLKFHEYDNVRWAEVWLQRNPEFLSDLRSAPCFSRPSQACILRDEKVVACGEACPLTRWGVSCARVDKSFPIFFWLPRYNPYVLSVDAEIINDQNDAVDLNQCRLLQGVYIDQNQAQHLLFNDGCRTLQLAIHGHTVLDGPVNLRCTLRGWSDFGSKPLSLKRLCQLYRQDRLVKSLYPKRQRASRWIQMLRAWDGFLSGAKYKEIAQVVYGVSAVEECWHDGYRARTQRLLRSAKQMTREGYLNLLL